MEFSVTNLTGVPGKRF